MPEARSQAGARGAGRGGRRGERDPGRNGGGEAQVPRALSGEDAGGRRERARPRDGRYKSAGGRRSAPAAPPLGLRSLPAPGFSQPLTCGCGGRPSPGSTMAGTRRAARRPRTSGSSPRAASPPPPCSPPLSPGRVPGRTGTAAKLRAGGRRAWRFLRQRRPRRAPTGAAPGSRGAAVGAARRSGAPADAPAPASVSSPFLPPARSAKGGRAGGAAAWGCVGVGSRLPGRWSRARGRSGIEEPPPTPGSCGGAAARQGRRRPRPSSSAARPGAGRHAEPIFRPLGPGFGKPEPGERLLGAGPARREGAGPLVARCRGCKANLPQDRPEVPGPSRVVGAESRGYYNK